MNNATTWVCPGCQHVMQIAQATTCTNCHKYIWLVDHAVQPQRVDTAECTCVDDEDAGGNRFRDWDPECPVHRP